MPSANVLLQSHLVEFFALQDSSYRQWRAVFANSLSVTQQAGVHLLHAMLCQQLKFLDTHNRADGEIAALT